MPKYSFMWKDPDFYDGVEIEEDWNNLAKLGIGEYLEVDVDTDTGTVTVIRPRSNENREDPNAT